MNPVARLVNLVRLVQAAQSNSAKGSLNKTKVHKLMYLACSQGIECDFDFRMHHYGPYSFDLEDAVQMLVAVGVFSSAVEEHEGWWEYKLQLGQRADDFLTRFGGLSPDEPVVKEVASVFGNRSTWELELTGTVHLVHSLLNRDWMGSRGSREDVVVTVRGLKPRFTSTEIEHAYDELVQKKLLMQ